MIPPYASEEEQGVGASFTPGPWGPETTVPIRGSTVQVAFLCAADAGSDSDVTARANLALIATAPELYEALDDCVRAREAWIGSTTEEGDAAASAALSRAHKKARAVLAKASGDRP